VVKQKSNVDVEPGPLNTIKVSQESPEAVNGAPKVTAADGDGEPESTAHPLAPPAEGGDLKPPQFENGDNGRMRVDRVPTADVGKVSADEAAKMRKLSQGLVASVIEKCSEKMGVAVVTSGEGGAAGETDEAVEEDRLTYEERLVVRLMNATTPEQTEDALEEMLKTVNVVDPKETDSPVRKALADAGCIDACLSVLNRRPPSASSCEGALGVLLALALNDDTHAKLCQKQVPHGVMGAVGALFPEGTSGISASLSAEDLATLVNVACLAWRLLYAMIAGDQNMIQPWVDEGGVKIALDFAADADSKCDGHQEVYGWSLAALRALASGEKASAMCSLMVTQGALRVIQHRLATALSTSPPPVEDERRWGGMRLCVEHAMGLLGGVQQNCSEVSWRLTHRPVTPIGASETEGTLANSAEVGLMWKLVCGLLKADHWNDDEQLVLQGVFALGMALANDVSNRDAIRADGGEAAAKIALTKYAHHPEITKFAQGLLTLLTPQPGQEQDTTSTAPPATKTLESEETVQQAPAPPTDDKDDGKKAAEEETAAVVEREAVAKPPEEGEAPEADEVEGEGGEAATAPDDAQQGEKEEEAAAVDAGAPEGGAGADEPEVAAGAADRADEPVAAAEAEADADGEGQEEAEGEAAGGGEGQGTTEEEKMEVQAQALADVLVS